MVTSATVKTFDPLARGMDSDPMLEIERIFVYFLQNLFRTFPEGCGLRWSPNDETCEMIITSQKPELSAVEKVPHIVCIMGSSQWGNVGLDQMQHVQFSTGRRVHTDLISSTMAYHCQAKEGTVAKRMAWNASLYTNVFRRILMRVNGIHKVAGNHSISAESDPSAYTGPLVDTELVGVVVTVPFFWQPAWVIQNEAVHVWRKMKVELNINKPAPIYSAGRINQVRPPRVRGRVVSSAPIGSPPEVGLNQKVEEDSYPT